MKNPNEYVVARKFLEKAYTFIKRDILIDLSYKTLATMKTFKIFLSISTLYFMSIIVGDNLQKYQVNTDYFSFALVGVVFSNFLSVGLNKFSEKLRASMNEGSLETMFVSPTPPILIILFSCVWGFLLESIHVIIALCLGIGMFGVQLANPNYGGVFIILVLTIIAFSGIGLISASIILVTKKGDPVSAIVTHLSILLGGTVFPVAVLPEFLQKISYILPITHSLNALRMALLEGASIYELTPQLITLAAFSLILFPIGIWVCNLMTQKAKMVGSLASY